MMTSKFFNITRNCATWTNRLKVISPTFKNVTENFPNYLPRIIETSLIETKYANNKELKERIISIWEHEALAREPIHGNLTMFAFDVLAEPSDITEKKLHQIKVIAWAVELVQSYYNIADDIQDNAETRSGKPCWHVLPDVGLMAVNDASLLRSFIYEMIKNNLDEPYLFKVQNYLNETYFSLSYGQYVDLTLTRTKDLKTFTMEQYSLLCDYKSSFYTVKLPILLALTLCNKESKDSYNYVNKVCTDLGLILQMQNDVMDFISGDSGAVKAGLDIQNKKCSWPAVAFLQNCTETQRREFESCYGRREPERVQRVHHLYNELNILGLYRQEEKKIYETVMRRIGELPPDSIPSSDFFVKFFEIIRHYTGDISPSNL